MGMPPYPTPHPRTGLFGLVNNAGVAGIIGPTPWQTLGGLPAGAECEHAGSHRGHLALGCPAAAGPGPSDQHHSVSRHWQPREGLLCASKFGLEAFSDSLEVRGAGTPPPNSGGACSTNKLAAAHHMAWWSLGLRDSLGSDFQGSDPSS